MFLEVFEKTIKDHQLISEGDNLLVALSGGSDSVAMLLLLCEYSKKYPELRLNIHALHFNHQIRGKDADDDQDFCVSLCSELGVHIEVVSENIPEIAKKQKKSLEETARDERYVALRKYAKTAFGEKAKIAVAHNKNDREETVFFNIARGTSIDGLRGIRYSYKDIIRPLLDITKSETYEICKAYGIKYRVDKTNFETDATRNKIRLKLIPEVSATLDIDFGDKLSLLSDFAETDGDFISIEAEKAYKNVLIEENVIDIEKLLSCHKAISSRVVKMAISSIYANGEYPFKDGTSITKVMIDRVLDFAEKGEQSKAIGLGKNAFVKKRNGRLSFFAEKDSANAEETVVVVEDVSKENIKEKIIECKNSKENDVLFDKEELMRLCEGNLPEIRNPMQGDVISPFGGVGSKQLRRFLIDNKVDNEDKKSIKVLAYKNIIFHVFGMRRSKFAPIQENTEYGIIFRLTTKINEQNLQE